MLCPGLLGIVGRLSVLDVLQIFAICSNLLAFNQGRLERVLLLFEDLSNLLLLLQFGDFHLLLFHQLLCSELYGHISHPFSLFLVQDLFRLKRRLIRYIMIFDNILFLYLFQDLSIDLS